jgi:hypothetical protein
MDGTQNHCADPAPVTKQDRRWMGLTITLIGGSDSCCVDPSPVMIMGDGWKSESYLIRGSERVVLNLSTSKELVFG